MTPSLGSPFSAKYGVYGLGTQNLRVRVTPKAPRIRRNCIGRAGLRKVSLDDPGYEIHLSHFTPHVLQKHIENLGFRVLENSLDPVNVAVGRSFARHQIYYLAASSLRQMLKVNIYDTVWLAAKKQD